MTHIARQGYLLLMVCLAGRTVSACRSPYLDLCGYNENESNATEYEDYNELYNICDCQQVTYCSVVELSKKCNSATILFNTSENITVSTKIHCNMSPVDSQGSIPVYKILNRTENEFVVSIFTEFDVGRFAVSCEVLEIEDESTGSNDTQWEIISVDPAEVLVDTEAKLQLAITGELQTSSVCCIIKTPDNITQILSTTPVSDTQVDCAGFNPGIPGTYIVSLSSSLTTDTFNKGMNVKVTAKQPVLLEAKYSYDFQSIFIDFDENVEIHSTCGSLFPQGLEYFGLGFDCYTRGNVLVVKMGEYFKIINDVVINSEGKICGTGSESCLSDSSVNIPVSKPKLLGPNLSFHLNPSCTGDTTQKYMSVNVIPPKQFSPSSRQQRALPKNSGKRQRKNLIIWRMIRQFQNKLSARHIVMQLNTTDVNPLSESLASVENVLAVDDNLASTASVIVRVQSSPAATTILAEATVTFCGGDSAKSFGYKWFVNERDVVEDGKLLLLKDLLPGKYVVKCVAVDSNSTEVLGQGWATTEIFPADERIIIVPLEITVGATDSVFLRAMTWHGNSVSWTCRTELNGSCFTTDNKSLSEVVNFSGSDITVPAGALAVGSYIWRAEIGSGWSEARVLVRDGSVTEVGVEIASVFVKPSEEVVAMGTVGRMQKGCRAWWSSSRQKGFGYSHLNTVADNPAGGQLPLEIHSQNWKNSQPDTLYLFQLQVFCPQNQRLDYLKLPLVVSKPPRVSPLTVQPQTGEAMITHFEISSAEADASVDDYPLTYEWSYVDPCDVEVPIGRGAFPRNFATYLPPGDVRLNLKVCNSRKTCSTTSTPIIGVVQSSEFPGDNFRNARNQIGRLMSSGDSLEAFGLATTVLKSLAFLAETTTREEIYKTVEESIKNRIEELTKRATDRSLSLEFYERAVTVAKYLRKGSDIMERLIQFRNTVSGIKGQNQK